MKIYQTNKINRDELKQITRLHFQALKDSFLNKFGVEFLLMLYRSIIENNNNITILLKMDKKIIGFAVATKNPNIFIKNIIFDSFIKTPFFILKTVYAKPLVFLKATTWQFLDRKPIPMPELQFIAVNEHYRNQKLGRKIIKKLTEILKNDEINEFIVGTKSNDQLSNNFYKKLGYKFIGTYTAFGQPLNYYLARYLKKNDSLSPKN